MTGMKSKGFLLPQNGKLGLVSGTPREVSDERGSQQH